VCDPGCARADLEAASLSFSERERADTAHAARAEPDTARVEGTASTREAHAEDTEERTALHRQRWKTNALMQQVSAIRRCCTIAAAEAV
jgi:hypothetical protein